MRDPRRSGIAFVEIVISALILGWVLLAVAPLFLASQKANASANQYGEVNNLAGDLLERLLPLPLDDARLSPGKHSANDLPATLPDPGTGAFPSPARNPFRRTYRIEQLAIPPSETVPRGGSFAPVRVTGAGLRFDYKRIDVTVEAALRRPELGLPAARVSGIRSNPFPDEILSDEDPDP